MMVGDMSYAVKKYFYLPHHLTRRFPKIVELFAFGKSGEMRLWLIQHQLQKLMKAASDREPVSDIAFAKMMFSFWSYSTESVRQLEYFIEMVMNSGAPGSLVLDLARPEGFAIKSARDREVKHWIGSHIAKTMFRGRYDLAVQLACRFDCFGAAKRIRERDNAGAREFSFRNYDERIEGVLKWVRCDMKAQKRLRDNAYKGPLSNLPCANYFNGCNFVGTVKRLRDHLSNCDHRLMLSYPFCKDCQVYLRPGVDELHVDRIAHYAVCEKRPAVFTGDRNDLDLFEPVPFPPAGPFGPVKLIPPENNDRIFGKVYESCENSRAPGSELVYQFGRIMRYA